MEAPFPTSADADRSEVMSANFTKYYLPDGRVLHHFTAANDAEYHDHPFPFDSTIGPDPAGGYTEEILTHASPGCWRMQTMQRLPGATHRVEAGTIHRLTGLLGRECWTVITPGAKEREPGFYRIAEQGLSHRFWFESDWHPWPRA